MGVQSLSTLDTLRTPINTKGPCAFSNERVTMANLIQSVGLELGWHSREF